MAFEGLELMVIHWAEQARKCTVLEGEGLEEGNVITIESGIYIPEENIGIRMEDDYWIVSDGAECLSAELPRDVDSIQEMARASMEDEDEDDEEDYE